VDKNMDKNMNTSCLKRKKSTKGDGRRRSKPKTNNNDYKAGEAEFVGSVSTQITINGFQDVLAQITTNNFFLSKDKDK